MPVFTRVCICRIPGLFIQTEQLYGLHLYRTYDDTREKIEYE